MNQYIVERGDTLSDLAEYLLGEGYSYWDLLEYNPQIEDPDYIEVGDVIYYPSSDMIIPGDEYLPEVTPTATPVTPSKFSLFSKPNIYYLAGGLILLTTVLMTSKKSKSKEASI